MSTGLKHVDMTIIIIIIIIIAFKVQFEIFYNLLTAPWTISNMYAQVARAQSCANHMQHIERLSRAIIIAFKVQFEIFYNLLTAPWTISNMYAQVARAQSCANHMQHIERLSRATCRATCHVIRRDSSAIKFDRVEIAFIWALFYWLNH